MYSVTYKRQNGTHRARVCSARPAASPPSSTARARAAGRRRARAGTTTGPSRPPPAPAAGTGSGGRTHWKPTPVLLTLCPFSFHLACKIICLT